MKKNKIKKMMAEGKPIINGWLQIPSSFSAEVMANQGWDSLTIDMQHGVIDYPNALQMLQSISTTETTPLARVNWNEPGQIMKILDAGCYGIICPMVSNRKEAENFVQACLYPPDGYRSYGPIRGLIYGGGDYGDHANTEILKLAMYPSFYYFTDSGAPPFGHYCKVKFSKSMPTKGVGIYLGSLSNPFIAEAPS